MAFLPLPLPHKLEQCQKWKAYGHALFFRSGFWVDFNFRGWQCTNFLLRLLIFFSLIPLFLSWKDRALHFWAPVIVYHGQHVVRLLSASPFFSGSMRIIR